MEFNTHTISSRIAPYISSIFHFKDFMPDHSVERVVPTGHIFIIFELDNIPRHTFDNETLAPNQTYQGVWISGIHKHYISISAHPKSEMLVIQFQPFGAYPFLHIPAHELNGQIVLAEKVFGDTIKHLREEIKNVSSSKEKFELVEKWLLQRFDETKLPSKELLQIHDKLYKEPAINYPQIVEAFPQSQKHLIQLFKKYIGLTPKYYQRILRFNEILHQIKQEHPLSWAQIAYQSGYSDQSHFIKEFKHFSGFNPQSFLDQKFPLEEANFFPLDREG